MSLPDVVVCPPSSPIPPPGGAFFSAALWAKKRLPVRPLVASIFFVRTIFEPSFFTVRIVQEGKPGDDFLPPDGLGSERRVVRLYFSLCVVFGAETGSSGAHFFASEGRTAKT